MLAARCAWTILRAEHAQFRQSLASIAEAVRAVHWGKSGPTVTLVRSRIESLQAFDLVSHRPKGTALIEALRGRSPEADQLLNVLDQDRARDDALLVQALAILDAAAGGNESAGVDCVAMLVRHRERVLNHLDQEETLLCALTEQLLTEEEWSLSLIVSAISSALYSAGSESVSAE